MARQIWTGDRGTRFYTGFALMAALAALVGFSTTYFMPIARGAFGGPVIAHVHGLLFFGWIALFFGQAVMARSGRMRWHRRIGWAALPLALLMAASGIGVCMFAVRRDLALGAGNFAYSQLVGVVTAMSLLPLFVAAALSLRQRPDWHKRLMVLAMIAVLWPAWFRWRHLMPWVPRPDIWLAIVLADSLILIAMIRDHWRFGRVHPAYAVFGTLLIAEHVAEALLFDTQAWRHLARTMFDALDKVF